MGGVTSPAGSRATGTRVRDLDVVFLAWRESADLLDRHVAAVAGALSPGWEGRAVLVQNGAAPPTAAAAQQAVQRWLPRAEQVVLRSERNLGFGQAMNLALDTCTSRYVAVLNSDGRPEPDCLVLLAEALEAHPRAVAVAPAVHGPGEEDQPPGPPYAEERLPGTALMIRRAAFLAAGGFDPAYFFYNEDYDASRRLRAAGHQLLRVPDAVFHHVKDGRTWRGRLLREWHYARTAQLLALHHAPAYVPALVRLLDRRVRSLGGHARHGDTPAVLGIAAATVELPRAAVTALARRRRSWNGRRLADWLEEARQEVEVVPGRR